MKTKQKRTKVVVSVLALAGLVVFSLAGYAGRLEPSAPPASTMKTLDQVEPRSPIPRSWIWAIPYTISDSGSYYLAQDFRIITPVLAAIIVEANDVTIDLMGFSIVGPGPDSGTNYGIYLDGRTNVEIRNGTVRDFGSHGLYGAGLAGKGHRAINVRATSNGGTGIYLDSRHNLIKDSTANGNGGDGICVSNASIVTGNTACDNNNDGIDGVNSTITTNTVYFNGSNGIFARGPCTVKNNTAMHNGMNGIFAFSGGTITGNTTFSNQSAGIYAFNNSMVTGNTVCGNNGSESDHTGGIHAHHDCLIKGNNVTRNKRNNICVDGFNNTIEENLVTRSDTGIYLLGTDNIIINNTARDNSNNYDIAAGNAYGQIINVAGGGSFVNSDPTANFEF
ncbi:MAG: right-handed parallel beta-helix repeat-containing protein [Planctomycetota bacterium]